MPIRYTWKRSNTREPEAIELLPDSGRSYLPPIQHLDKFIRSMTGTKPAHERHRTRREDDGLRFPDRLSERSTAFS